MDFGDEIADYSNVRITFWDILDMIPFIGTGARCTASVVSPSDEMTRQCALNAAFDGATIASGGLDLPAVEATKVAAKAAEKAAIKTAEKAVERDIERVAENVVEKEVVEEEVLRTVDREGTEEAARVAEEETSIRVGKKLERSWNTTRARAAEAAAKKEAREAAEAAAKKEAGEAAEAAAKKEAGEAASKSVESRITKATLRKMNLQELYNFAQDIRDCEETFVDIIATKVGELSGDNTEAYVKLHDLNPVCWNQDQPIAPPGPEDRKGPQRNPDAHPLIFVKEIPDTVPKGSQDTIVIEVLRFTIIVGILLYAYSKSK